MTARLIPALALAAFLLSAHGDLHEQIERVSAQIRRDPSNPELYLKRGELHRLHQQYEAAERDYARASPLPAVHLGRARLHAARKQWPAAVQALEQAPESEAVAALRGEVYGELGQPREAARAWRRAIELAGAEPKVEYFLSLAAAHEMDGRHDEAIGVIDEGLRRLGPLWTLDQWAIESEARAARWDHALARLDRAAAAMPRKEPLLARKAEIQRDAGRPAEARRTAEAAREAMSQLPDRVRRTKAMVELDARITALLKAAP